MTLTKVAQAGIAAKVGVDQNLLPHRRSAIGW